MFIAKVKKAQLYLNSAELTKTFVATLPKGRYQYEILNFEQYEKPEISITGAKLLSHSAVEDKETVKEFEKKIEKLREEIKKLDIEIKKLRTDEALIQEGLKQCQFVLKHWSDVFLCAVFPGYKSLTCIS